MSLCRVCDRCGHIIEDAKDIKRVMLCDNYLDPPYVYVCIRCCREIFDCFFGNESWNNRLHPNMNKENE